MDFIDHRSTAQFTFLTSATNEKIRINADGDLLVGISTPFDTSGITLDATGALGVDGHIRVASGATYDIGSATNKFRNLYLSGDINVAGASTSGDLTVGGSLSVTTDATVTGSLTVSTDATIAGNLTVSTNAAITNDLTVSNDATISGDLTVSTNAVIAGDLTVNGTTTTINTETLDVKDKNITLNYGGDTTSANGAGITIEDAVSAGNDATILWDGGNDTFDFSHAIDVTGTITANNNLTIQNSNAYGSIELGGVSGGFIDIKRPFSDDYDLRLIAEGDGGVINVASGELTIQRAGSAKLATSSAGVDVTGDIAVSGTVDGRDVATDGLKLDGIEASADVTDTTNVTAAGALMDSEVTNLDQVKAFDSSDYATAAQGSTADSALQNVVEDTTPQLGGDLDLNGNDITGTGNIDVTGTATMDGLDVQGNVIINNSYAYQIGGDSASTSVIGKMHNSSGVFTLASLDSRHMKLTTSNADRLKVDANGDISFYDSAGSSQSLFWDASTEFLGLGSTTPQAKLDIVDTASDVQMRVYKFDGTKNTRITLTADDSGAKIHYRDADNAGALRFNNNLGEVMRIPANTTRLGIGTSNPTTELEVDGVITTAGLTTTANINFGDNDKAIFGAGSDVSIYSDGTNGLITSTANFTLDVAGDITLDADGADIKLLNGGTHWGSLYTNSTPNNLYLQNMVSDGDIYLSGFDGGSNISALILDMSEAGAATFNAGASFGGTVTADGLEVEAATPVIEIDSTTSANLATLQFATSGTVDSKITHQASTGVMTIDSGRNASWGGKIDFVTDTDTRMRISNNGDISFYEDTGTTAKFFWDSSAESLGIGTSSPSKTLDIEGNIRAKNTAGSSGAEIDITSGGTWRFRSNPTTGTNSYGLDIVKGSAGTDVKVSINSAGNVGIGTSSPTSVQGFAKVLKLEDSSNASIVVSGGSHEAEYAVSSSGGWFGTSTNIPQRFATNNAERMRIDASGNLLVGKTAVTLNTEGHAITPTYARFTRDSANPVQFNRTTNDGDIATFHKDGTTVGSIGSSTGRLEVLSAGNNLRIGSDSTVRWALDSTRFYPVADATYDIGLSGNRVRNLYLSGNVTSSGTFRGGSGSASTPTFLTDGSTGMFRASSNDIGFSCAGSEVARFDSSGNLLVGKTDTSIATQGVFFGPNYSHITSTNDTPLALSRKSSDGTILDIRKDGTTVGSIFNSGTTMGIGSLDTGVLLANNIDAILPWNASTNAERDAAIDLGRSAGRFKDLYLSGTAYVATSIGIGTSSPETNLHIEDSSSFSIIRLVSSTTENAGIDFGDPDDRDIGRVRYNNIDNSMVFHTNAAEQMRIDSTGRVGLGTTSPDVKLDIVDTAADVQLRVYKFDGTNNTRLTLTADDSGAKIHYRDATNGGALRFNNNAGEMARFDSSSNLLVGDTSAAFNNTAKTVIRPSSDNWVIKPTVCTSFNRTASDGDILEFYRGSSSNVGSISVTSSATAYNTSSDQRLKDNIVDAPSASDDIDAIQVRSFDWKADGSHQKYGMVAQELQGVAPEAVSGDTDSDDMMGVDYSKLVPMMLKEIQSLRARVAQLEGEN